MSLIPHHTSDPICALCEYKLTQADPKLATWFRAVKLKYLNLHISWSYRNKEEQEQVFTEGKSLEHFPNGKHNQMMDGKPCSKALDVFPIDERGRADWDNKTIYAQIAAYNAENHPEIHWGGNFAHLHDTDHFEIT
jgi:hypothetical protein